MEKLSKKLYITPEKKKVVKNCPLIVLSGGQKLSAISYYNTKTDVCQLGDTKNLT